MQVVVVSDAQKSKLDAQFQAGDRELRTTEGYIEQYNESFQYSFVASSQLAPAERAVFEQAIPIVDLLGPGGRRPPILISETMRAGLDETNGVSDSERGEIVINRRQLRSLDTFAGTLLHELAHARTGAVDATRSFENILTEYLGTLAASKVAVRIAPPVAPPHATPADGEPPLTSVGCPHCGARNRYPRPGILACGRCRQRFEVLADGNVRR